jgi:hypothetical protein
LESLIAAIDDANLNNTMAMYTNVSRCLSNKTFQSSGGSCVAVERISPSFLFMLHHQEAHLLGCKTSEETQSVINMQWDVNGAYLLVQKRLLVKKWKAVTKSQNVCNIQHKLGSQATLLGNLS